MAYKGKAVTVASASHLVTEVKDFMLACGWTLEGPSTDPAAQDDDDGLMLGWFLKSTGENGTDDIKVHLGLNTGRDGQEFADCTYLSAGVTDTDTSLPVQDASAYTAGDYVRVQNEMIIVGTVDIPGNSLNACTRGACGTTKVAHDSGKVVQHCYKVTGNVVYPFCAEVFAVRDMGDPEDSHPIAASSGTVTWSVGKTSTSGVSGLGGYTNDRFNWHTLVQVWDPDGGGPSVPGPEHAKMRWCIDYSDGGASGSLTFQPFKNTPGAKHVRVLGGGFLPGFSRRFVPGTSSTRNLGTLYMDNYTPSAGMVVYMYGCKDGVALYVKQTNSVPFYFGNVIPYANPLNAVTTADAAKGDDEFSVNNTDLFCVGQKYRVISQSHLDWDPNKTPDAPFPVLDAEEIPTQEIIVETIGTGTITFSPVLKYSFKSGAVIGEDPRPAIRMGYNSGAPVAMLHSQVWVQCYLPCKKEDLGSHASFRQFARAYHTNGAPQTPYNYYWNSYLYEQGTPDLDMGDDSCTLTNKNRQTDQFPLKRWCIGFAQASGSEPTYSVFGRFYTLKGVVPLIWAFPAAAPGGAVMEDTMKAVWEGAYKTFRVLTQASAPTHILMGPEIWP